MPKLYAPNLNDLCIEGQTIERAEDGSFEVPADKVAEVCAAFGMTDTPPKAKRGKKAETTEADGEGEEK